MIPEALRVIFEGHRRPAVALSGGVDSAVLAALAVNFFGPENILTLTATGPIFPPEEVLWARKTAEYLKVPHIEIEFPALDLPAFKENPSDRCYHCKKALGRLLWEVARREGAEVLWDGTQFSDLGEHRPGLKALKELGIGSPLLWAGLSKEEIRTLARKLGLPQAQKPPSPCLATRFPPGEPIEAEILDKIYQAEGILREILGVSLLRLRYVRGEVRLEVPPGEMEKVWQKREEIRAVLRPFGFRRIGLDLAGYGQPP